MSAVAGLERGVGGDRSHPHPLADGGAPAALVAARCRRRRWRSGCRPVDADRGAAVVHSSEAVAPSGERRVGRSGTAPAQQLTATRARPALLPGTPTDDHDLDTADLDTADLDTGELDTTGVACAAMAASLLRSPR